MLSIPLRVARLRAVALTCLPTLLAAGLISACGAASNDNSGSLAGVESSSTTAAATGCSATGSGRTDDFKQAVTLQPATAAGLVIGDIVAGSGASPQSGHLVTVQYTGWLADGTMFDSSRQAGRTPFMFHLGQGDVIPGWDQGVAGMKVGGVRRLVIPPALAYGAAGSPPAIPANATLTFDIELLCAG
ncbi:MAG TPA: FKBP-type peptidyl-prolyl cis-trans isomerase [Candidatus Dormibacteraeota bacterium]